MKRPKSKPRKRKSPKPSNSAVAIRRKRRAARQANPTRKSGRVAPRILYS